MLSRLILIYLIFLASLSNAQTFQDFLDRVNGSPEAQRAAIVDSFLNAHPTCPVIEQDTIVHFIFRGNASRVNVAGDANGWDANASALAKVSTTNLWYRTETFEIDARLDYKFVVNGTTWLLDSRNKYTCTGGFGPNSELRMPAYVLPPEISFYANIPHGTLWDTTFYSSNLGNSRKIRVYTPPGYPSTQDRYPSILFHDGLDYVTLASATNTIDFLIAEKRIDPIIAIFVPAVNRTPEYAGDQQSQFGAFICSEVLPFVDRRFRTRTDPASRAVIGASNGGNISLWLGFTFPSVFGKVAAQSSNIQSSLFTGFRDSSRLDLQLYLDLGTYDIAQLIPLVRTFVPILQAKGYSYQYAEYHEGHSWGNWRAHIDNALEMFFPGSALSVKSGKGALPMELRLNQNYPNPFNGRTTITYATSEATRIHIDIFDLHGRFVTSLINSQRASGTNSVTWDGCDEQGQMLPTGIYFYRITTDSKTAETKRMLLLR